MDSSANPETTRDMHSCIWTEENLQDCIEKMAQEAARQLHALRYPAFSKRLKDLVRRMLGRGASCDDRIFWPAGLLLLGLMEAGHTREVADYLGEWRAAGMPVKNPDDALTGVVLERLHKETGEPCWKEGVQKIHRYLEDCRQDAAGSIVYGQRSGNSWIYADGAGQTAMFYAEEGQGDLAQRELDNFARYGIDETSGLPYHGYDVQSGLCQGIIGWGRAVGWLLLGISAQERCEGAASQVGQDPVWERLCWEVLRRRRSDGLFSWQLDCRKGPVDTSASGMIYYSLLRGGFLPRECAPKSGGTAISSAGENALTENAREVVCRAAGSLLGYVDENGCVQHSSAECIDFAQYRQQYGCNAWGQGAVLAFLAAYAKERQNAGEFV